MKLGIENRWALVCAGSKGLGKACAKALAMEGVNIVLNGRTLETLEATASELKQLPTCGEIITIAADITTPEGRTQALNAVPHLDILVNNAGGPPPGNYLDWSVADWQQALNNNMITAIELMKVVIPTMQENQFGRIINITSSAVKSPIPVLGLSNGARSGLTGFVAGLARTIASDNVTINNILPGAFATNRLLQTIEAGAKNQGIAKEAGIQQRLETIPAGRFGEPDEFGALCAYLCSIQAAYITGQNILIDGGAYPGTY